MIIFFSKFKLSIFLILFSLSSIITNAAIHFTESFTSPYIPQTYTTGNIDLSSGSWELADVRGELAANAYGSFGGAARLSKNYTSYLITPSVNSISSISFYYRALNTASGTFKVQKSINGGAFVDVAVQAFNSQTYSLFSITIDDISNNLRIKILSDNNPENLIVDEVTLTSIDSDPIINLSSTSLSGFSYITGSGPSASQSYTLSGSNLASAPGQINVTAPTDYEISLDDVSFSGNLNIDYTSTTLSNTTVYVRLKSGLSIGSYNSEVITNSGGGATTMNVSCSGSVTAIPPAALIVNPSSLSGFTYVEGSGPSASQSYILSGSYLTGAPGQIAVTAPSDYEISTDNSTFSGSLNVGYTSATLGNTTIYVRLKSGLSIGSYNSEVITNSGGGATTMNVSCSGSVTAIPPAALIVNPSSLSGFTYVEGSGPSASQSYILSGSYLTGAPGQIAVTAPSDYEISIDNSTFSGILNVGYTSATLANTTIYVRLKSGLAIGNYNSEVITNSGGGATTMNVSCNGSVTEISNSCATDLIISEYHEPISGNNKGVEIYNGTGSDVDLSAYYIGTIVNGGTDIESNIALSGILGDKQTACIYNDADVDPNFRLKGNINITWSSATWNGDDAIYLLKGGATKDFIIDAIGDMPPVTDPGSEFINNGVSTLNTCLIRKSSVLSPTTTWSGLEWDIVTAGTYTNWGIHTMTCSVGFSENNNNEALLVNIFPNPANRFITIYCDGNIDEIRSIKIINILGVTMSEITSGISDILNKTMEINLNSGIYYVVIESESRDYFRKIIVTK